MAGYTLAWSSSCALYIWRCKCYKAPEVGEGHEAVWFDEERYERDILVVWQV